MRDIYERQNSLEKLTRLSDMQPDQVEKDLGEMSKGGSLDQFFNLMTEMLRFINSTKELPAKVEISQPTFNK